MERPPASPLVKKLARILVGLLALNLLYSLIGFYGIPAILKSQIPKQLSPLLKRSVTIDEIRFNPYALKLRAKGLKIASQETGETLASVGELFLEIEGQSIIRRSLVLKEAVIVAPSVNIIRNEDQTFNFSDLLSKDSNPDQAKSEESPSVQNKKTDIVFILKNISIKDGHISILDQVASSSHLINGLNVYIPLMSNYKNNIDQWIEPDLIATINGSMFYVHTKIKPFLPCLQTIVDTNLSRLDLLHFVGYLPPELKLRLVSGQLNADAHVEFSRDDEGTEALTASAGLALSGLEAQHADGSPLARIGGLDLKVDRLDPFQRTVHVSQLALDGPEMHVSRDKGGRISLESVYTANKAPAPPPETATSTVEQPKPDPFTVDVDLAGISGGIIHFTDQSIPRPFKTTVKDLALKLQGVSNREGSKPTYELAASTESQEKIQIAGDITLDPLTATGTVETHALQLPRYAPYYGDHIRFALKEGTVDLKTDYRFALAGKQPDLHLGKLAVSLKELRCTREGDPEDFLTLPSFDIRDSSLDLRRREIVLKDIRSVDGTIFVRREADGSLNLLKLTPAAERASESAPAASAGPDESAPPVEETPVEASVAKNPWKVVVAATGLKQFTIRAEDQAVPEPLAITADQLDVDLKDFTLGSDEGTDNRSTLNLSLRLNGEGTASIQGDFGLTPLSATFKVICSNLDLTPSRSYIPEHVKVRLNGGKLSTDGELKLAHSKVSGLAVEYAGSCLLSDLAAVDKTKEQAILGWKGLDLQGVKVSTVPLVIHIEKATVQELASRVAISPERKLNLLELVEPAQSAAPATPVPPQPRAAAPEPAAAPPPTPAAPEKVKQTQSKSPPKTTAKRGPKASTPKASPEPASAPASAPDPAPTRAASTPLGATPPGASSDLSLLVQQIVFENGLIDFSDESIQPPIRAQMMEISGTITGLSSDKSSKADINLKGSVEKRSPLAITGKLSPFADDLFAEVKLSFKDFDMTRLDPYARKYMGYTLEKGNLTLDLTYLVAKRRLDSQNNIFFDQLRLGDKVESPDAVGLPLKFAISLLQDRSGGIRLEIPVQGRVDDPKFGLGKIIWKAISNLILKAVTAPFALLGALFGGGGAGSGEDLGYLDFDPGSTVLSGAAVKKVETIAKIMYERPGLQIDLEGQADPVRERDLLRQARIKEIIKAQKAKEPVKKGKEPPPAQGEILPAEQESLLRKAFAEQIGNEDLSKKLSLDVIKKQLLDKVPVSDDEVKAVAAQRATAVRDHLVSAGKIEANRIFLVEPKLDAGTGDKQGKLHGVIMKLK
ncbi:MAG: DUF748 domain-containing protein [Syntrophobacteraceae bacterium]